MSTYRKHIDNNTFSSDDTMEFRNLTYVDLDVVRDTLDDIENRVNGIKDMLKDIHGLNEIDNVKELVKDLTDDLY